MTKPKFFRDPLHLQIRFESVDLGRELVDLEVESKISWTLRKIIDTETFQRLRYIRQNGLANLVFHGAEHSRFSHSMGVSHLARRMYAKLCLNSSLPQVENKKLEVAAASLVHDVGHGPFSHTMEEILNINGIPFDHEFMTRRFITDPESEICKILMEVDGQLPKELEKYFDKTLRDDHEFTYKIVSSQMDADRMDYVQRDALFCGIRGHGFDMERLLDLIFVTNNGNIAVDRGAIEALEAYLLTLDQMWRAVYYHQAVRSGSVMMTSLFKRAYFLHSNGDTKIFPSSDKRQHPIKLFFEQGTKIDLDVYLRLTDFIVWTLIDGWRNHSDWILSDLSERIVRRNLLKSVELDPAQLRASMDRVEKAKSITKEIMKEVPEAMDYYVIQDDPTRTSYSTYDWMPDASNNSIWLTGKGKKDCPIEEDDESGLVGALRNTRRFDRLYVTSEVREKLI